MLAMWGNDLKTRAEAYVQRRRLVLLEPPLGDGTEGNVWTVRSKDFNVRWALKLHRHKRAYERERDVYARLAERGVTQVIGMNVPQLIRSDDEALALEMTIVVRPFALDFAAAFLDLPPEFTEEVWAEREAH